MKNCKNRKARISMKIVKCGFDVKTFSPPQNLADFYIQMATYLIRF